MIVSPDAMSASRAPSTRPLKSCEMKFAQFSTPFLPDRGSNEAPAAGIGGGRPATMGLSRACAVGSDVVAELAAEGVGGLDHLLARDDLEHLPEVLVVAHVLLRLAANENDRPDALVVLRAVVDIADQRRNGFALLVLLDDIGGIEGAGFRHHARPVREAHVAVLGAPLGPVAPALAERLDEHPGVGILFL